jgi:type I restriction enzyme R subunit
LELFARGGKKVHGPLQEAFCQTVLGVEVGAADPLRAAYQLDHLLDPDFPLRTDAADRVAEARIIRMRLHRSHFFADRNWLYTAVNRKRQMLIAMATGTGKTFTMVNQVYRLMKSGVARRVQFLVDRRALAAQAIQAFASFEPEPGLKFDKIYEVYRNRFQRGDLGEDEKFDPKVLPQR